MKHCCHFFPLMTYATKAPNQHFSYMVWILNTSAPLTLLKWHTWDPTAGKVTPCSRRFLIIAEIRLSWGSLRKSSAHSTIRAFSFSHTLGWPWGQLLKKIHENKELEEGWLHFKYTPSTNGSHENKMVHFKKTKRRKKKDKLPCLKRYWLHSQTLWSTPPSGISSHS